MQGRKEDEAELRRQAEDAVSTKDEIMENMKAQQREFAIERRSLEEEIQSHKGKIEEVEDELEALEAELTGPSKLPSVPVANLPELQKNQEVESQAERTKQPAMLAV